MQVVAVINSCTKLLTSYARTEWSTQQTTTNLRWTAGAEVSWKSSVLVSHPCSGCLISAWLSLPTVPTPPAAWGRTGAWLPRWWVWLPRHGYACSPGMQRRAAGRRCWLVLLR